jgi:formylglycine-generating enzyme required for sulfatase activity
MGWLLLNPEARALAAIGLLLSLGGCASSEVGGVPHGPATAPAPVLADLQMVRVPGGLFRMGSSTGAENVRPPHLAIVQPFRLSRYEITVGQFSQFVRETGYQTDAELNHGEGPGCRISGAAGQPAAFQAGASWRNPGFAQTDRHPVVCVSYNDSHAFLAWLNGRSLHHYRLPSEAEWEFSARADSASETAADSCAQQAPAAPGTSATTVACSNLEAQPVGSSKPNRFGLYDLLGNASELVEDCWHPDYKHAPRSGTAWASACDASQQITVVGAWISGASGVSETRTSIGPASADDHLGFRIAENIESTGSASTSHY